MSAITRGIGVEVYGTIGTTNAIVLQTNPSINFLQIHNPSTTNSLAYTLSTANIPVINGVGFTLGPLGTATFDIWVPKNLINLIGSASGSPYSILWQ